MERLDRTYQKFLNSLNALERSINFFIKKSKKAEEDELEIALTALIKNFEICFEMSWKYLQQYLKHTKKIELASAKPIFRESFVALLITQDETKSLLGMAEARNATAHDYNEETAKEICERIASYYSILKSLLRINPPLN